MYFWANLFDVILSFTGPVVNRPEVPAPEYNYSQPAASQPAHEMPDSKDHIIFTPDPEPFTTDIE